MTQDMALSAPTRATARLGAGWTMRLGGLVLGAVALLLPFVASGYLLFQLTMVLALSVGVLGLNLLVGYNGQISLGHGAFYAIGSYAAAIMMDSFGWPYWAVVPVAAVVCFGFGFLFGLPALRLEGHHLALATFALAIAMPQMLKYKGLAEWTGGAQGIVLMKPDAPAGIPLDPDQWIYLFTLAVTSVMFLLAWNILRGRIGRAMIAIRDHPVAASTMGVNTAAYKSVTFGISSLYTGVGGALSVIAVQYVSADSFGIFVSISFLVGVVIGGLGTISGALFGAAFIQFVPNVADQVSKAAPWAVYGVFLILAMFIAPGGVVGLWRRLVRVRGNGPDPSC